MLYDCKFNKDRDEQEVIPGLSVDLFSAIDSGVVLDTGVVEEFNGIETPDSVHCRVRDVFHALELQRSYLESGKITQSSFSGSTEHGAVVSAPSTSSAGAPTQSE